MNYASADKNCHEIVNIEYVILQYSEFISENQQNSFISFQNNRF